MFCKQQNSALWAKYMNVKVLHLGQATGYRLTVGLVVLHVMNSEHSLLTMIDELLIMGRCSVHYGHAHAVVGPWSVVLHDVVPFNGSF